ncbi:MAG: hypothetical protein SGILL_010380 [Bacillariaceae sp.]
MQGCHTVAERAFAGSPKLEKVILGSCENIGAAAFAQCSALRHVDLGTNLQNIHSSAFADCPQVDQVNFPSTLTRIGNGSFDTAGCVFARNEKLTDVDLSCCEGLHEIQQWTFAGCLALQTIKLPQSLNIIGKSAFLQCEGLQSVLFPNGCQFFFGILDDAFHGCQELTTLQLPSSTRNLGPRAFMGCKKLMALDVPRMMNTIGGEAFAGCESLSSIGLQYGCWVQDTKLSPNVSNETLRSRFDREEYKLHEIVYFDVPHLSAATSMNSIERLLGSGKSIRRLDELGMTAVHIMAQSAKPQVDVFKAVLKGTKLADLSRKDDFGKTPADYLYLSRAPGSGSMLHCLARRTFEPLCGRLGSKKWSDDLKSKVESLRGTSPNSKRSVYSDLVLTMNRYQRMEQMSLLELALRKANPVGPTNSCMPKGRVGSRSTRRRAKAKSANQPSPAEVVIPKVLKFLDSKEVMYWR